MVQAASVMEIIVVQAQIANLEWTVVAITVAPVRIVVREANVAETTAV